MFATLFTSGTIWEKTNSNFRWRFWGEEKSHTLANVVFYFRYDNRSYYLKRVSYMYLLLQYSTLSSFVGGGSRAVCLEWFYVSTSHELHKANELCWLTYFLQIAYMSFFVSLTFSASVALCHALAACCWGKHLIWYVKYPWQKALIQSFLIQEAYCYIRCCMSGVFVSDNRTEWYMHTVSW